MKRFIGKSQKGNPIVATLVGFAVKLNPTEVHLMYTTADMVGKQQYELRNHNLSIVNIPEQPGIPAMAAVMENGVLVSEEIKAIASIPAKNNYDEFMQAFKQDTHLEYAMNYIEKNHTDRKAR